MTTTIGIVRINEHTVELPEGEAMALFLAAAALTRRPGALAINADTMVAINATTQMSLSIPGRFTEEYNPQAVVDRLHKKRGVAVL